MFVCGTNQGNFSFDEIYRNNDCVVFNGMGKKFIPDNQIQIGKRIKDLLDSNGLRQKDLSLIIGRNHSAVSKLCSGQMRPTQDVLEILTRHFGVSSDFIIIFYKLLSFIFGKPRHIKRCIPTDSYMRRDIAWFCDISSVGIHVFVHF